MQQLSVGFRGGIQERQAIELKSGKTIEYCVL